MSQSPIPAMPDESIADMWPYGLAALGALGLAGFAFFRKKKIKNQALPSEEPDTDMPHSLLEEPQEDLTKTSSNGSSHFGPSHTETELFPPSDQAIDDLHNHIFKSHAVENLIGAIILDEKDDKSFSTDFGPLSHLNEKAPGQMPNASFEEHLALPLDMPPLTPPEYVPVPATHHDFDAGLSFEDDVLDLSNLSFEDAGSSSAFVASKTPGPLVHEVHPHFEPLTEPHAVEEPLSMDFSDLSTESLGINSDPFTQAMNMARSTEARSSGSDIGKHFNIAPNVDDGPGRLQLELACLYAQSLEWENVRSTLKEILSDDEMSMAHPEARRLLAKIP